MPPCLPYLLPLMFDLFLRSPPSRHASASAPVRRCDPTGGCGNVVAKTERRCAGPARAERGASVRPSVIASVELRRGTSIVVKVIMAVVGPACLMSSSGSSGFQDFLVSSRVVTHPKCQAGSHNPSFCDFDGIVTREWRELLFQNWWCAFCEKVKLLRTNF